MSEDITAHEMSFYGDVAAPTVEFNVDLSQNSAGAWRGKVSVRIKGPFDPAAVSLHPADAGGYVPSVGSEEQALHNALDRNLTLASLVMQNALADLQPPGDESSPKPKSRKPPAAGPE